MSRLEYLGIPYSHSNKEIMEFRADVSDYIFAELSNEGRIIYAPISACHHISEKYNLPKTFDFWKNVCLEFVNVSDKLIVVRLPGWEKSIGLTAEIKLAQKLGKEIEYLDPIPYIMNDDELMSKYKELMEENNVKCA